ncbi:MAG: hypothetical protein J6334_00840 [Kiritimatiellae bacterium]|nr:hypothetical protein [Kiritimatiellia bacterium]
MNVKRMVWVGLMAGIALGARGELKVAPIFTPHMVFPAERPLRVFGEGEGTVTVTFNGKRGEAKAADGKWEVTLPAEPYGGPHTLSVRSGDQTITCGDIYVGEVYLLAGQSNLQFKLGESVATEVRPEDLPLMRSFSLPRPEPEPHTPADGWVPCTKEDARNWSAIGYHFGRTLTARKKIAIGLINCYQGASVIQSWMPAALAEEPRFKLPPEALHFDATYPAFQRWNKPGILYTKAFGLLGPFPATGVIWYQGESNTGKGEYAIYAELLTELIGQWRKDLRCPDLPFAVVQIADYAHRRDEAWRRLQAEQLRVPERCPHVTAVRCADICSDSGIHPPEKEALGKRLAAWALALTPAVRAPEPVIRIAPDTRDCSAAFFAGIDTLRRLGGGVIELEKGDYPFGAGMGREMAFFISNHDQSPSHPVNLPLTGVRHLTIRGNGARLIFHGASIGVAVIGSERVTLQNLTLDWSRPFLTEMVITGFEAGKTLGRIDKTRFPYHVEQGKIVAEGEGWRSPVCGCMLFRGGTHEIVERSCDVPYFGEAEERPDGSLLCRYDFSKTGAGAKVGDIVCMRPERRPYPAIFVDHAKETLLEDVAIHTAWGMGVIVQMSDTFTWRGTGQGLGRTAGTFAPEGSGRITTLHADASHFSNVKGKVTVENALFETMMDDAINVHSTCLGIVAVEDPYRIRCRYMHDQAYGFGVFNLHDTVRFIRGKTLENGPELRVSGIVTHSDREVTLTLSAPLPEGYGPGDAVENADYQPEVVFRGNVVRNNRARGALFTTPKPVLVENNLFDHVSGSAILFAGDAQGWYESGACEQVTVRGNRFRNCLTSVFQFCNGILSSYPMIRRPDDQQRHYHRRFTITGNVFETFDVPLLYACSTDEIRFEDNTIQWNSAYQGWGKPPVILERCGRATLQTIPPHPTAGK